LLASGIGKKKQLQFENIREKMVKKSIKFLFGVEKHKKNWTWYLKN